MKNETRVCTVPRVNRRDTLVVMRRKLMLWAGSVAFLITVTLTALQGLEPQIVAHVLDVKGEWHPEGTTELITAGSGLVSGTRVAAGSNRQGDAITIVRDEDLSRMRIVCDGSSVNPCRNPIAVSGPTVTANSQSQLKNIVQASISVLLSKPPAIANHYALTLARGGTTVLEFEAVVALDPDQGVVLPPAPDAMAAGPYTITSSRVGQSRSSTVQTVLLTSEGTWRPLRCDVAGLYEVSIANGDGEQVADVMLLVTPTPQFQARRESFAAMKTRTGTWTGPNARPDEHLFLRAFLISVSQTL